MKAAPDSGLLIRLEPDLDEALQAWIAAQPEPRPNKTQAIRYALRDWLTGQGLLPFHDAPEQTN